MGSQQLRVFFFPFMSPGHMIPLLETATLFSQRGVSVTIITTPSNAPFVESTVFCSSASSNPINLLLISFPSSAHHLLPSGRENLSLVPFTSFSDLFHASLQLHQPLLDLLQLHRPDCLIFDVMFHWAPDIAHHLSITSIMFRCPGLFALCVENYLEDHAPYRHSDRFVTEGLPHHIEMSSSEILESFLVPGLQEMRRESERKSFGIIVNSFYDLEPEYSDLFRKDPTRKAWFLGPVSLYKSFNGDGGDHDKVSRGRGVYRGEIVDANLEWLNWLETKPESSVRFVCFGSLWEWSTEQLDEIAMALEISGRPFLWVVKKSGPGEWEPKAKARLSNLGLVITKWVPQLTILNHKAVGGFMTHCGWNSVLESIAAGVPMIGWPLMYEQFMNEKYVSEVLKIGVKVQREGGNVLIAKLQGKEEEVVGREEISRAIEQVMGGGGGGEAEEMRRRVKEYKDMACKAMDEGGSSYEDLSSLIQQLKEVRADTEETTHECDQLA